MFANRKLLKQAAAAGVGGIAATCADLAVLVTLVESGSPVALAAFAGAATGAAVSFGVGKHVAFRDRSRTSARQLVAFAAVAAVTAGAMAIAMHACVHGLGLPYVVAKVLCAVAVFALWTFPAQRRFVFAPSFPEEPVMSASSLSSSSSPVVTSYASFVDLSIVVPAYNEEHRLPPTLRALHAFLSAQPLRWEIVVVDDGSADATAATVETMAAEIPGLRLERQWPNRGKGAAVRRGMLAARGQIRVMFDADGSMPPEQLPALLAPLVATTADIAIGSRYLDRGIAPTQPLYRRLWSRLCNRVIQRTLVPGIVDTQCGFKAFTAEAARDLFSRGRVDGWAFDLEILAIARREDYRIAEVAVRWTDDARSRVNPLTDMVKVIREAITIRRNLSAGVYRQRTLLAPAR